MKILMTQTVQGSLDGLTVQELAKGVVYDTVDSPRGVRLAEYHIAQEVAVAAPQTPAGAPAVDEPAAKRKAQAKK